MGLRMGLKFTGFGPIAHIEVPSGWRGTSPRSSGMRTWNEFVGEKVPGATISLFYRGLPVDIETADLFKALLDSTPAELSRELSDDEQSSLREILGPGNAGSNQFTDPKAPAFELDSAKVDWLAKQAVLIVRGRFNLAEPEQPQNEFLGVFVPAGQAGREIYEIFLQVPGLGAFEQCLGDFNQTLATIKWR